MNERDRWSLAWATLCAASFAGFAALESAALRQPAPRPTFTRSLARWFGCHPEARRRPIALAALAVAQAALVVHVARYQPPPREQP